MSDPASGAKITRLFDPQTQTHYALSEDAELELRMMFKALETFGQLTDTPPGQSAPEVEPHNLAPVFFTFGKHGQRIMDEMRTQFPPRNRRKPA